MSSIYILLFVDMLHVSKHLLNEVSRHLMIGQFVIHQSQAPMSFRITFFARSSCKPFFTNSLIRTYARGRGSPNIPNEDPISIEEKKKAFRQQFNNILENHGKHIPIENEGEKSSFWQRNKWAQPYYNTVQMSIWVGLVLILLFASLWIEEWWQNRKNGSKKKDDKQQEDDDDDW
jgi:hypothetical protein